MAETVGCLKALETAESFGISHIILEVDSSLLRDAATSTSLDLAPGGYLFRDIRKFLQEHFICSEISLVSRCNNSSAHELARLGFSWDSGQSHVWTRPLPICVNTHVTRELAESLGHNTRP